MNCTVIFGGTGFIGCFFAEFLLSNSHSDKVYLVDIEPIESKSSLFRRNQLINKNIVYVKGDVRKPLNWFTPSEKISLVVNLAAIHREPGHEQYEYFETNLYGAENICDWSVMVNCQNILFTSSISPYNVNQELKDETSLPLPSSAYGCSKLIAEKIHQIWQAQDDSNRRLVIVRPGVVFGPGEGGNVTRLIKAVLHHYFFYMGNQDTRKAGVYVKELCNAMWWVLQRQVANDEHFSLFNMSMTPGPSIQDYVNSVCKVAKIKRFVPSLPYSLLLIISHFIDLLARPLGIKHPFSPVRIYKLVRSNNISPNYLVENGYEYRYTLDTAFADWQRSCPEEWK